ncbi:MAG: hypothetical protein M3Y82_03715 [Verrucomicrobiota bacterium]|nr:hypothetical protein [Verrucomicrobiota bacterium]
MQECNHNSSAAELVKQFTKPADLSSLEFQNILALWKKYTEEYGIDGGSLDEQFQIQRTEAQRELHRQMQIILGDERHYACLVQDGSLACLDSILRTRNLPKELLFKIKDVHWNALEKYRVLDANSFFSKKEKAEIHQQIHLKANRETESILGKHIAEEFYQTWNK